MPTLVEEKIYGAAPPRYTGGADYRAGRGGVVALPQTHPRAHGHKPTEREIYSRRPVGLGIAFQSQVAAWLAILDPRFLAPLEGALAEISSYRDLEPNWDGEDAVGVSAEVTERAARVLRLAFSRSKTLCIPWIGPEVAPNPGGGLELSWDLSNRWVMLIVKPSESRLTCVTQEKGSPPIHKLLTISEALGRVLWALQR